jgi:glycosyltransferase involved in cell wall biosynthesis
MGVDCERFTPLRRSSAVREELLRIVGAPLTTTLLFYAGRLAPEKNLPLLLDVMAMLGAREYRLIVAGDGMMHEPLETACRARGIQGVVFPGHIAGRERLADYYANADIFVHPNPREPFGIAPLEAMASGLSLVAPNSGGVASYANETNAWLALPDAEAFVKAIREIRLYPEEARRRTAEGLRTAESHAWPLIATQYLRLYRELDAITKSDRIRQPEAFPIQTTTWPIQPAAWSTPARWQRGR